MAKRKNTTRSRSRKNSKSGTLHQLFITKLCALYDIEQQIIKALPLMAKNASDSELRQAFTSHLKETQNQARRLERAAQSLGVSLKKEKSEAIRGLTKDAEWVIKNVEKGPALDANLIAAAQYVEHYEIAGYGSALEWAKMMGHDEAAHLLEETLNEEKATDEKLSGLATSKVNEEVPMGIEEEVGVL